MFPQDEHLNRWIKLAQKRVIVQGLPVAHLRWVWRARQIGLAMNVWCQG